ncbi:MAG TPA: division/cell wall cluster transcriptional repressor MraZ [Actinomycetota bacterium]|jgi:MraZ protein|nr:division/cell wall cluster transcriptional repressor MraZ [Actinomycetota bacterium]
MWVPVEERGAQVAELLGEHLYQMDPKGRISLPAKFREGFEEGIYLTLGQDGCLFAFPQGEWDRRKGEVESLAISDPKNRAYARMFFGRAERVDLDAQGRLVVPRKLRDDAHLGRDVAVVGVSDRLEIWDRQAWDRYSHAHEGSYSTGQLIPER